MEMMVAARRDDQANRSELCQRSGKGF